MVKILENIPLGNYTTFKIGGPARYFCAVTTDDELVEAVSFAGQKHLPLFILGGGSNLIISDDGFRGLVIKVDFKGISYDEEKVTAAAGEQWDDLVHDTVEHGLSGIENLSAIPGTVGAAPVQNIGAYGAEISRVVETVRVFDVEAGSFRDLAPADCGFAYRDSMFKHHKGKYVVTHVTLKLVKGGAPNLSYKDIREYFAAKNITNPSISDVREAVIAIRWGKLPDWKLWGTAGSFFKNPVISKSHFDELKRKYPLLPGYPEPDGRMKIPLGWILEFVCKAKGLCIGNVCTYEKQALVVVAKPGATASEVVSFTHELMKTVKEKTDIDIEAEVEWVN